MKLAKKIVASWLYCKVGTLKIPLRATTVTGTEKSWQCFANTGEARRVKINEDGRYIVRTMNEPSSRSCNAQDGEESTVEFM